MAIPMDGLLADRDFKYSINEYAGDGETVAWPVAFGGGFLDRAHVQLWVRNEDTSETQADFEWIDDETISITPAVAAGTTFRLYRITPRDKPLTDFGSGAFLTEANLDLLARQAIFIAAEASDKLLIASGKGDKGDAGPRGPAGRGGIPTISFGGWKAHRPTIDLGDPRADDTTIFDLGVRP